MPDIGFQVRFQTEIRAPGVPVGFIGAGNGVGAPGNSPPPIAPGTPLIPPAITALDGKGSEGLSLRQTYEVTLVRGNKEIQLKGDGPMVAVPSNADRAPCRNTRPVRRGPLLARPRRPGVRRHHRRAFFIDLGAAFNSLNFRAVPSPGSTRIPAVLSDAQDRAKVNFLADDVSGYNVNSIAIRAPITLLTRDGSRPGAGSRKGPSAPTAPPRAVPWSGARSSRSPAVAAGSQVQRMGNPLFNELLIGTGFKDRWSRSEPEGDAQFAAFALDPLIARVTQAAYAGAFDIPAPPRNDLLPLVTYAPPIAAPGTSGPGRRSAAAERRRAADAVQTSANRLGLLGGDTAGFPNGRRPVDDVTDIVLRVVVGGRAGRRYSTCSRTTELGRRGQRQRPADPGTFPYVAPAQNGRNGRHVDPGEPGCATLGGNANCPVN